MADQLFRIDLRFTERVEKAIDRAEIQRASGEPQDALGHLHAIWEPVGASFERPLMDKLMAEALSRFQHLPRGPERDNELDKWLAPRIHYLLRLPRAVAADDGLWRWLAVVVCRPYMLVRWPEKAESGWWRYNSQNLLRNGIARLWWAAELVRNGPDYRLVPQALKSVRTFHNVSELRYSMHRETARAFTRVVGDLDEAGDALSVAFNAYLATHGLEYFDRDYQETEQFSWDHEWGKRTPEEAVLLGDISGPVGPKAGYSRSDVEERLFEWLNELARPLNDTA